MKCPACRKVVAVDAKVCANCGCVLKPDPQPERAAGDESTPADAPAIAAPYVPNTPSFERPDGSGMIMGAYGLGCAALISVLFAWNLDVSSYGDVDLDKVSLRWWLFALSGGLFQLAIIGWVTGKIVNAIWFVAGDERKAYRPSL